MTHETRRVRVEEYALCQQTLPKHWFGNMNMTSNCGVTNKGHEIEWSSYATERNPPPWKSFA